MQNVELKHMRKELNYVRPDLEVLDYVTESVLCVSNENLEDGESGIWD